MTDNPTRAVLEAKGYEFDESGKHAKKPGKTTQLTPQVIKPVRRKVVAQAKAIPTGVVYKSDYERQFAEYLEKYKLIGDIEHYQYEPFSLELCDFTLVSNKTPTIYTPDFVVKWTDKDKICVYEVKGYMFSRDSVRLKWAVWRYRDKYDFYLVTKIQKGMHKGNWKIKPIGMKV